MAHHEENRELDDEVLKREAGETRHQMLVPKERCVNGDRKEDALVHEPLADGRLPPLVAVCLTHTRNVTCTYPGRDAFTLRRNERQHRLPEEECLLDLRLCEGEVQRESPEEGRDDS